MLSFDDFSIKRKYKEKTVRTIKISLESIRRVAAYAVISVKISDFSLERV